MNVSHQNRSAPRSDLSHRPIGRRSGKVGGGAVALLAALLLPSALVAQVCMGDANVPGQFTLGGYGAFADGGNAYGVESRSNLPGAVGMGAYLGVIDLEDADDNITSAGGHVAYELPARGALSLCPVVGLEYDFWSGTESGVDLDYTRWAFPVAFGVGSRVGGTNEGLVLIPSARAGLIHQRFGESASAGPLSWQREGNQSNLFLDAAATVQLGALYARGGLYRIFQDGAETVFRVGGGLIF
ncbi:MAG: hypothetical protein WD960_02110 [Gemmatimonadota bacterium]